MNTEHIVEHNEKYILSSLDGALGILNLFFEHEELSATEISKLSGASRSSVFRFLVTLENRGYLTKDENSRYRLGIKLFTLGQLAKSRMELTRIVHPFLETITDESGETSQLVILEGAAVLFADKQTSKASLKMDTPLGQTYPAHQTGGGKAILAFKGDDFVEAYIKEADFSATTQNSITSASVLCSALGSIRKNGYAKDAEEAEIGLTCYAVPLLDEGFQAIAAISISGPTTRVEANEKAHIALLQKIAHDLHGKLC